MKRITVFSAAAAVILLFFIFCGAVYGVGDGTSHELRLIPQVENEPGITVLPLEMYMTASDYSNGVLTVTISNQSGYIMGYGNEYSLEKYENGSWNAVVPVVDYCWTDVYHTLVDLTEAQEQYDLSVFGELTPGLYRLVKTDLYAEFTLGY